MSTRFATDDPTEREAGIAAAALAVQRGRLVVLPTDTVYGVGADAFSAEAVRSLLAAKGRGRDMPPPVLVSAATTLDALAVGVPSYARALVQELWPGPLTLVCRQQPSLQWDLGDTRGTVAVRMPDHEVALELLSRTGPLAVSSANRTGLNAATDADAAEAMLGDKVEVLLDSGATPGDVPSTIVDVTGETGRVLRLGAVPLDRLNEIVSPVGATIVDEG
jgi:L-threonylcarbamoyladenylate synthase